MEKMSDSRTDPTYTVFIRVPFPRGDFVDPPPVNWDSSKDDALWNMLLKVKTTDIDWSNLANHFQVTVDFLLQQVTYLNERHNSKVRAIIGGLKSGSNAPSPVPGAEASGFGGEAMRRTASGGGTARAPSSLSLRRESPAAGGSRPSSATPSGGRPNISRKATPTTTAVPGQQGGSTSPRLVKATLHCASSPRRRLSSLGTAVPTTSGASGTRPQSPTPSTPASEPSSPVSSSASSPAQSRIIRRPPKFNRPSQPAAHDGTSSFADDDLDDGDESETPAFMPQPTASSSGTGKGKSSGHDLNATLRGDPRRLINSQTSDSSASSAAVVGRGRREIPRGALSVANPLSPRRTAELAGKGGKGKGQHGYSSDGTPSMGSSFSDLDDASVTQSALEEALASRMQGGETFGSRMSVFGQALRSRYIGGNQVQGSNQGQGHSQGQGQGQS